MRPAFIFSSLLAAFCLTLVSAAAAERPNPNLFGDDKVRLVIRADDFGFSHASNMALRRLLDEGTITTAGVIVNTGWLDETVKILQAHPR